MNVLIDATSVTKKKAGVGVYAKNLIHELVHHHTDLHLVLVVQDDDPELDYSGLPNVTMIRVPATIFRRLIFRFLLEQIGLPLLFLRYRIQVVHSLHYSFPLLRFGTRQVVTLHDMTSFSLPEVHIPAKRIYFRTFIRGAASFVDHLLFVSESSRNDFIERMGQPSGLTSVTLLGKSELFRPDLPAETVDHARMHYKLPEEFILYVGTIEPRKNLTRLVRAFASIAEAHPDLVLVIAGMKGWMFDDLFEEIRRGRIESRVLFPGFVREVDKPYLIAAAKVFVYPSLYEGFGLPVLEALSCGTPTVTSNLSSLPEVAGEAALLVDPTDEEAIAGAIEQLLLDPALCHRLRDLSVAQAAKFTWNRTADLTARAYELAAAGRSRRGFPSEKKDV